MSRMLFIDKQDIRSMIAKRKRLGQDRYDEVWEGMYVMPSLPTNKHQKLVDDLGDILTIVVKQEGRGEKYPGANVSDREKNWKRNYRCPDIVVVLNESNAIDCDTHFCGGPDLVVEIKSPGDETEDKIPFYASIGVRELLIIHRDRRTVRLLRHDGVDLVEATPASEGKHWLVSEVVPLEFRTVTIKNTPRTEVRRTDGKEQHWMI